MLEKCINISKKTFSNIYVITDDKLIKKKYEKQVKFINLSNVSKLKPDYFFSVLNDKILPLKYLKFVKKYSLNFHDGPLPKYAGLFSSTWAIYNNEKKHGVSWHKIEKSIDTGEILFQKEFSIEKNDTAYEVDTKGIIEGIKLFRKIINNIKKSSFKFKKQKLKKRSYFGKKDLKSLYKKFLKNKKNKVFSRAFSVSTQKDKILFKYFNIKIKNENEKNYLRKLKLNLSNENKLKKLINFINKTIKTDFKFNKKKLTDLKIYSLNNHPKWDSLSHVKLLNEIESKFRISINEKNINNFSNVEQIFNSIFHKI